MNLRALAREYADGILGIQAYRKARDELIENIISGKTKVTAHDFQPPLKVQRTEVAPDITSIQPRSRKQPAPNPTPPPAMDKTEVREPASLAFRVLLVGVVVIIVLLLVIVALYPLIQRNKSAGTDTSQITAPVTNPQPGMQRRETFTAGGLLIKQFLHQNDWTAENLQQFTSTWQGLSAEERDNGLTSSARTELANAIFRKLQEERIMLGLGDVQDSIDKQNILVTFAQQMGINDPRIIVKDTP